MFAQRCVPCSFTATKTWFGSMPPLNCSFAPATNRARDCRCSHSANGLALAQYLSTHPKVSRVLYPGLPGHPHHELARRQMPNGSGGMLTFEVESFERAREVLNRFRLMSLAESLGGVETLVCHPASMTHASVPPDHRRKLGITDGLVRISVGIEDVKDLIADLDQAFL